MSKKTIIVVISALVVLIVSSIVAEDAVAASAVAYTTFILRFLSAVTFAIAGTALAVEACYWAGYIKKG